MKWHQFDAKKGYRQKRPPLYKPVLVLIEQRMEDEVMLPRTAVVGYRKDAAGDKSCPYFVTFAVKGEAIAWCDCLPEGFVLPDKWKNMSRNSRAALD